MKKNKIRTTSLKVGREEMLVKQEKPHRKQEIEGSNQRGEATKKV